MSSAESSQFQLEQPCRWVADEQPHFEMLLSLLARKATAAGAIGLIEGEEESTAD